MVEAGGEIKLFQGLFIFKVSWLLVRAAFSNRADDFSSLCHSYVLSLQLHLISGVRWGCWILRKHKE